MTVDALYRSSCTRWGLGTAGAVSFIGLSERSSPSDACVLMRDGSTATGRGVRACTSEGAVSVAEARRRERRGGADIDRASLEITRDHSRSLEIALGVEIRLSALCRPHPLPLLKPLPRRRRGLPHLVCPAHRTARQLHPLPRLAALLKGGGCLRCASARRALPWRFGGRVLRRAWCERLGSGAAPPPLQLEVGLGGSAGGEDRARRGRVF